jgi:hypothetical protein
VHASFEQLKRDDGQMALLLPAFLASGRAKPRGGLSCVLKAFQPHHRHFGVNLRAGCRLGNAAGRRRDDWPPMPERGDAASQKLMEGEVDDPKDFYSSSFVSFLRPC